MAILKSCCCSKSIRSGSFASAIYTMMFYTVVMTAGGIHMNTLLNMPVVVPVILLFCILTLIFSGLIVVSSFFLIIGLCMDNKVLMLPWMMSLSVTTVVDFVMSLYFVADSVMDPFVAVFLITDISICLLNIYCLLCVLSQYQEYVAGRGRQRHIVVDGPLPAIHFEPASCGGVGGDHINKSPKLNVSMLRNGTSSSSAFLLPNSGYGSSSSGGQTCSSPFAHHLLSRSSISSTSEISFTSSGGSASSRRGSTLIRDRSDSCYARNTALTLMAASTALGQVDRFHRRLSQLAIEENSSYPVEEKEDDDEEIEDDPTHFEIAEIEETDIFVPQQQPTGTTSRFKYTPGLFRRSSDAFSKEFPQSLATSVLEEMSTIQDEETEINTPTSNQ